MVFKNQDKLSVRSCLVLCLHSITDLGSMLEMILELAKFALKTRRIKLLIYVDRSSKHQNSHVMKHGGFDAKQTEVLKKLERFWNIEIDKL